MTNGYESLANAIILQAVKDYRQARQKIKKRPRNEDVKAMLRDCESFFLSEWFTYLTSIDGEVLLKKLQEETE